MTHEAADWLSWREGAAVILDHCRPLSAEVVPLGEATGRALVEPIRARVDHPPWDNSAMDGYAVRSADAAAATAERPVTLPVSADIPAGSFPDAPLSPGTAVRVMTGAAVPTGATGVIRVEHTDGGADQVSIFETSDSERNIRRAGEDFRRGDPLLRPGDEISPAVIGLLALNGIERVDAGRRPRVGVLANGDELVDFDRFDQALAGHKLMNSNNHLLAAQLRQAGAVPHDLGISRDEPEELKRRLEGLAECDALVSTAGVSVGEHDHVKAVLAELGMQRLFWRVRVRPGSALLFGTLDGKPVWGLPGNPISAMVAFEIFVRPGLRKLAGHRRLLRGWVAGRAGETIGSPSRHASFLRVRLEHGRDGLPVAHLAGEQGSGFLSRLVAADALALVPERVERIEAGERIELLPLHDWRFSASAGERDR